MTRRTTKPPAELKTSVELITPERAAEWLEHNENFRNVNKTRIHMYQKDMEDERWSLNGQPIIFNGKGGVIDGQHRLMACVQSNVSFWSVVVRGVVNDKTIDGGKPRTFADWLHYKGEAQSGALSAAVRIKGMYDLTGDPSVTGGFKKLTISELTIILDNHPGLRDCTRHAYAWSGPALPPTAAAFLSYEFGLLDKDLCEDYGDVLAGRKLLSESDPVMQLRKQLYKFKQSDNPWPRRKMFGLCILAWNYWRRDHTCGVLRFRATGPKLQDMPEII